MDCEIKNKEIKFLKKKDNEEEGDDDDDEIGEVGGRGGGGGEQRGEGNEIGGSMTDEVKVHLQLLLASKLYFEGLWGYL